MAEYLNQRYRLLNLLGRGGSSIVYKAIDILSGQEVAAKILNISGDQDEMVSRFLTEAQIATTLNHPNTLKVHTFGRSSEGQCFLISELLVGQSLQEYLVLQKQLM